MQFTQRKSGPRSRRSTWTVGKSVGLGAAAGAAAAAAALLGPKTLTSAKAGKGHPLKHRVLDLASGALQRKYPVEAISTYLNGFHMYADDMGRQVEASHFCIHLRHDLHQCVIFDRNAPGARLIGIEYIISEERFRGLPDDEKRLWHSHHYEVKSGILVAPGIPDLAEHAYFEDLVIDLRQDVPLLAVRPRRLSLRGSAADDGPDRGRAGRRGADPRPGPQAARLRAA